jgi:hypothetical protein
MAKKNLNLEENTEEKFVAFLDVLGFKELVNKKDFDALDSYFSKLLSVLDDLRDKKQDVQSFIISDSIILIAPKGLQSFIQLIKAIQTIQSQLIWRKIIIRGAVSYGDVYYNGEKNIIVGKGYIRAYLLEQEAVYPRVIIDPAIIKVFDTDKQGFLKQVNKSINYNFEKRLIYQDSEYSKIPIDSIFVDYANRIIKKDEISDSIEKLYETIRENLYSEQKLFSKYMWLKEYFLECLSVTKGSPGAMLDGSRLEELIQRFKRL